MPSTSPAQKHMMAALAHGWRPDDPKLARIPISVAKEYNAADQAKAKRTKLIMAVSGERK
jgi:hypothetical protein